MPLDIDMSDSVWAREERARGATQGITQGITQGERELLTRLLDHRFGPIANHVRSRIGQATKAQIEEWAIRALGAQSLADVFGE